MKKLLQFCLLSLIIVMLVSLCACSLQGESYPSDEIITSTPTQTFDPTVSAIEETDFLTETPTDVAEETEPYTIDEDFELFSEADSTYWYVGSDQTITLKDFGLEITLPDGWVDRVEIIRNVSQDYLDLFIGNSELMKAYEAMDSAEPKEHVDIKGTYGYFDWILCVNGIRKDNYDEVERLDHSQYYVYLGENETYRFYFAPTDMRDMNCNTFMITREMMIRKQGQEYYDNLVGDLTCSVEQAREILKVT